MHFWYPSYYFFLKFLQILLTNSVPVPLLPRFTLKVFLKITPLWVKHLQSLFTLMKTSQNVSYFSQVHSSIEVLFICDPLAVYGALFLTSALWSYFSSKFSLDSCHLYHSDQQPLHLNFVQHSCTAASVMPMENCWVLFKIIPLLATILLQILDLYSTK